VFATIFVSHQLTNLFDRSIQFSAKYCVSPNFALDAIPLREFAYGKSS